MLPFGDDGATLIARGTSTPVGVAGEDIESLETNEKGKNPQVKAHTLAESRRIKLDTERRLSGPRMAESGASPRPGSSMLPEDQVRTGIGPRGDALDAIPC